MKDVASFIRGKSAELSKPSIRAAATAGKTLRINTPSTVFTSVTWQSTSDDGTTGIATAEFVRGGKLVYDYEMDLENFIEWGSAESLEAFFNDVVRE